MSRRNYTYDPEERRINEEYKADHDFELELLRLREIYEAHTPEERAVLLRVMRHLLVLSAIVHKVSNVFSVGSLSFDTELLGYLIDEHNLPTEKELILLKQKPLRVSALVALLAFAHWERGEAFTYEEMRYRGHPHQYVNAGWSIDEANPFTSIPAEMKASVDDLFKLLHTEGGRI